MYSYLQTREAGEQYPQRSTDLVVVETGLKVGVQTYIIMSPTIYGLGAGHFNKLSIQIPALMRSALKTGQSEVIGDGSGVWDHVHIADLAPLYELLLIAVVEGKGAPSGQKGIFFSGTGRFSWLELARGIGKAGFERGALRSAEVRSITLDEAAEKWAGGSIQLAELGFASK